jgi:hypothetical protein
MAVFEGTRATPAVRGTMLLFLVFGECATAGRASAEPGLRTRPCPESRKPRQKRTPLAGAVSRPSMDVSVGSACRGPRSVVYGWTEIRPLPQRSRDQSLAPCITRTGAHDHFKSPDLVI